MIQDPLLIQNSTISYSDSYWIVENISPFLLLLIPISILLIMWGVQLFIGYIFPRRTPILLGGVDKRWDTWFKQNRTECQKELESMHREFPVAVKVKGAMMILSGCLIAYFLLNSSPPPDDAPFKNLKVQWSQKSYFKNKLWQLRFDNKIVDLQNDNILGEWKNTHSGLLFKLDIPYIKKSQYERTLYFKNVKKSQYLHSFEMYFASKGHSWYETGQISFVNNGKTKRTQKT